MYQDRIQVPLGLDIRTRVLQEIHDSTVHVHPGQEAMYAIVTRQFFQPGILKDIRTFVENYDRCRSNKAQRTRRQGFLKPLLIPHRIQSEILIDFITKLPKSKGYTNIVVIIDQLSIGVVADRLKEISTKSLTDQFLRRYYLYHFLPIVIMSNRGGQFTSVFQKRVYN